MEDEYKKETKDGGQKEKKPLFAQEPKSKRMRVTRQTLH